MLKDRHLTQLVFTQTAIKTWALSFAHLLIFRAGEENSLVLSEQGHVRIAHRKEADRSTAVLSRAFCHRLWERTQNSIKYSCSRTCLASFSWSFEIFIENVLAWCSLANDSNGSRRVQRAWCFVNSPTATSSHLRWFLKTFWHC